MIRITNNFLSIYFLFSYLLLLAGYSFGQVQDQNNGTHSGSTYPSFIRQELNFFEYKNKKIIDVLVQKWNSPNSRFVIAHFGDSHVQPDYFPGTVRRNLQKLKGDAGRGMIFPYSIAKTYSQSDYSSTFEGKWITGNSIQIPPRLPAGVSGFAAHTKEKNASFSISFKNPLPEGEKIMKIYCETYANSYKLTIISGDETHQVELDTVSTKKPFIQVNFKSLQNHITFKLMKDDADEREFKLYGISLENKSQGVLYHNLGVGGACFSALLYLKNFEKEFPSLNSDFVICDWGGNDFMYKNKVEPQLEEIMLQTIKKIRKINPEAIILIPSAQDINKKGKNVTAAKQYAALARKVALENDCLFYDWFVISGGPKSMFSWSDLGISSKDNVHLNAKGYKIKGDLFTDAFLNTIKRAGSEPQLVFENEKYYATDSASNTDTSEVIKIELTPKFKSKGKSKKSGKTNGEINHLRTSYKVRKGDTLGSIASKHNTSVSSLKKLNGLKSDKLKIGKVLIIGR